MSNEPKDTDVRVFRVFGGELGGRTLSAPQSEVKNWPLGDGVTMGGDRYVFTTTNPTDGTPELCFVHEGVTQ
jgi:hypothetical protein